MFAAARTQWQAVPHPGGIVVTGLRVEALDALMRILKVADPADCLARIQVMEAEALALLNAKD